MIHLQVRLDETGVMAMPHMPRKRSETGFYHVVAKGSGNQIIFESAQDREYCLRILEEAAGENRVDVHAYCLMGTHIHLLIEDASEKLSDFMKRFSETYAMHFNWVTGRVGSLFVRPFWNEAVESNEYFLSALRYIHANPEPAGICSAADYEWSSYRAYLGEPSFAKTNLALELLGGVAGFEEFSASGSKYVVPFPGSKLTKHLSADELWRVAEGLVGRDALLGIRGKGPRERAQVIKVLVDAGFRECEIVRVTGLGKSAVNRAINAK